MKRKRMTHNASVYFSVAARDDKIPERILKLAQREERSFNWVVEQSLRDYLEQNEEKRNIA